jgi:hypothetical protein
VEARLKIRRPAYNIIEAVNYSSQVVGVGMNKVLEKRAWGKRRKEKKNKI